MAHIQEIELYESHVDIIYTNGYSGRIHLDEHSGSVYFRYKIGLGSSWVKHPGVYIGRDWQGTEYWVHNHYQFDTAHIVTGDGFRLGKTIQPYYEYCINPPLVVVYKALEHVMAGEEYKLSTYNCQTMVNDACNNQRRSEDVDAIVRGVVKGAGFSLGVLLIGSFISAIAKS